MLQFVSVQGDNNKQDTSNDIIYLGDDVGSSLSSKYNYAIDKYVKEPGWYCFRHDDLEMDITPKELDSIFANRIGKEVGICGVIGSFNLEADFTWKTIFRQVNGAGSLTQSISDVSGNSSGQSKTYTFNDWPGYHDGLAVVDGCVLFIHSKLFAAEIRFDEMLGEYNFYDTDICLQALERGFGIATVPVRCVHNMLDGEPKRLVELRKRMTEKWLNRVDGLFPVNRFTKFQTAIECDK